MYIYGNIYKIIYKYNTNIVYIGSTFKTLQKRLQKHKLQYKYYKSGIYKSHYRIYDYFDEYGINDFLIFSLKTYKIHNIDKKHNKLQLLAYEQLWINKERYNKKKYLLHVCCSFNPATKLLKNKPILCKICNKIIKNKNYLKHIKSLRHLKYLYYKKIYDEKEKKENHDEIHS